MSSAIPRRAEAVIDAAVCAASMGQTRCFNQSMSERSSAAPRKIVWQRCMCVWTKPGITAQPSASITADTVIDADGCAVIPGFVQTHIHLCQTIFRGAADDLSLIDWLKQRVWPMEA